MNDKYMQPDIAELVGNIAKSIDQLNKSMAEFMDWQKRHTEASIAMEQERLRHISDANTRYMSGRWPRRDGDKFSIMAPTLDQMREASRADNVSQSNADRQAGDIRPPKLSGD